ncbi:lipoyl(octanoyl) transferase LIP2 Ecym_4160 [Eremothecium cymbalariae DBVPG|uniref:Octanoyltransferase n=1 Tax=Eremothecium cymbalariae (strain CBS 270.75 / DBVPG 7215 / KCTC 17166 / NRRL Y-17582) TaxID=931890 RepID=G8JT84_ERECY|nr:hypothetical protein Ecym_4160 [Eremothecium cymbalariae DBVPG\
MNSRTRLLPTVSKLCYSAIHTDLKKKTYPIVNSARKLKHFHYGKLNSFEEGLRIQESFVLQNLEIKRNQSLISRAVNEETDKIAGLSPAGVVSLNPTILTFEFEPTYTGGKRTKKTMTSQQVEIYENFIPNSGKYMMKPKFVQVERGGQVTFHGPGQLVAYLILDLKSFHNFPARCLVSTLESAIIKTLRDVPKGKGGNHPLNLQAMVNENTGVWVNNTQKIASIGINVRRSITSHGISINVCPELSYMNNFEMCGLPDSTATSIYQQVPDATCDVSTIAITFVDQMASLLGIDEVERINVN